ncbi:MAG: inosine/xanthosine triphosphatase [Flammeovirgaceae bacterium]
MKVIIASKNPVKVKATQLGFEILFPNTQWDFQGVSVPSGVADQPMTQEETLLGAIQRTENARKAIGNADFWVGIEGGVATNGQEMEVFAWIYILSKEDHFGKSRTANFYLPPKIQELVSQGIELGTADDMVFKQENSKQKGGSVGILTDGNIDRTTYYQTSVILALIPFLKEHLYIEK